MLEALLEIFPRADLYTTILEPNKMASTLQPANTSFIQHLPGSHTHNEWFVPLMQLAWRRLKLSIDLASYE